MEKCPYCGGDDFEIEMVNQVEVKKCKRCGSYVEDVGNEFPWQSFVPLCERDANGRYPFCPKCGCKNIRRLTVSENMIRGNLLAALITGESYVSGRARRYECQNPKCKYSWN